MKEVSFFDYASERKLFLSEIKLNSDSENKLYITKLNNIYVHPKLWSVITKDFYIFNDFERYLSQYKHYKDILLRKNEIISISKYINKIEGKFFLFGAEKNYWHFLIDFMPRLICLKHIVDEDIKIIISDDLPEYFINFMIKICNLFGVEKINFFKINRSKLIYHFENLIFTSKPSIEFTSNFFNNFLKYKSTNKIEKNLYVKRGNTINRKVINEDEVISLLDKYDYHIIDCADISVDNQIKYFSEAKNIILPSGAAMANLIFSPNKINVVEIRSNLDGDFSKNINLNNRFFLFPFENTTKVGNKLRKDIIVDTLELEKLIKEKKIY